MERALCAGDFPLALPHLGPILLYGAAVTAAAVVCFLTQMKKQ
jgi:hypothetical protein